MPANDIIPVWVAGDDTDHAKPSRYLTRAECRELKKARAGYFCSNGKKFILRCAHLEVNAEVLVADMPQTRDESANIKPPTMDHYVDGQSAARVVINFWSPGTTLRRTGLLRSRALDVLGG